MSDTPRLEQALEAYLAYTDQDPQQSWEEFLRDHGDLRDLLEPMHGEEAAEESGDALRTMGDFVIHGELGRGGMGVVYRAEQRSVRRPVALKVLPAHLTLDAHAIARFQREASLAGRLDHPGIVEVYTVGSDAGSHFFAMELIDGISLADVLKSLRLRFPEPGAVARCTGEALRECVGLAPKSADARRSGSGSGASTASRLEIFRQDFVSSMVAIGLHLAEALDHAHNQQILHRDVKPSNVMLRRDGRVVLTDFGLARESSLPSMTLTGDFVGTPFYVAPEQARGDSDAFGPALDVFSLGATLYEMVTLQRPFPGDTAVEVLRRISDEEPIHPSRHNREVHADLAAILLHALEKDPTDRYPTAGAFAADLRALLEHRPIQARRITAGTRTLRWAQRNRALAATIATALGLLLLGSMVALIVVAQQNAAVRSARDEAVAVKEFLVKKLILAADPNRHQGDKPTVEDVLDRAAAEVAGSFSDAPLLAAEVRQTLGRAWFSLGAFDKSIRELRLALATREELLGTEHDTYLETEQTLASALKGAGEIDACRAILATSLPRLHRVLGAEHPLTLDATLTRAQIELEQGDLGRAETWLRECVAARLRVWGENHAETLEARHQLARTLRARGALRKALAMMKDVLTRAETHLGPDAPQIQSSLNDISDTHHSLGEREEAMQYGARAMARAERIWGKSHPKYILAANMVASEIQELGRINRDQTRLKDAEARFLELLTLRERVFGGDSLSYAVGLNNYGVILSYRGKRAEAAKAFQDCLRVRQEKLGADDRLVLETRGNLAALLILEKRAGEALGIIQDAAERSEAAFGASNPHRANILLTYGTCLRRLGRHREAETQALLVHRICEERFGPDHNMTQRAVRQLIAVYDALGETEKLAAWRQRDVRARRN